MRFFSRVPLFAVAFVALGFASTVAVAQEPVASADAAKFMGAWVITLDSPQGSFNMTLTLSDKEGKAVGELTSEIAPPQAVTDITKSGDDLVLKYEGNYQGQAFAAKITLTPNAEKLAVAFDVMDGQFMMSGMGVKK
jgi:hypothetical protein